MVNKTNEKIEFVAAEYIKNPFGHFFANTENNIKLLALIPFVRNIIEYTKGETDSDFTLLTSTLHINNDTNRITVGDIKDIINRNFSKNISVTDEKSIVAELFIETANKLLNTNETLNLENKIVLSVAIRLKAESFMINEIGDSAFLQSIKRKQTAKISKRYIADNPTKKAEVDVIKKVNLITPQNIHINSFMYEPILDMSDIELKTLYTDVLALK